MQAAAARCPATPRRRGVLLGSILGLAVLVVGITAAYLVSEPAVPQRRLPDGSTVYLDNVVLGGRSVAWESGPRWKRFLATVLPPQWVVRYHLERVRIGSLP